MGWDLEEPAIVPHRLAVSPAARGLGVAKHLMGEAETLAIKNNCIWVRVDTNAVNIPMNSLFQTLGFSMSGKCNLSAKPKEMWFNCYQKKINILPGS